MDYYYEAEVKQLIIPSPYNGWEVVYNTEEEEQFVDDIIYFAICDLKAMPYDGKRLSGERKDCIGVILPVIWIEGEGLVPLVTSYYLSPDEQKSEIRRALNSDGEVEK